MGTSVVSPMRRAWGRLTSSASSATMPPTWGRYQLTSSIPDWKPIRLPKDIFITASARLFSTAQAAFTFPLWHRPWNSSQAAFMLSAERPAGAKR